jgi:hypothetical protein
MDHQDSGHGSPQEGGNRSQANWLGCAPSFRRWLSGSAGTHAWLIVSYAPYVPSGWQILKTTVDTDSQRDPAAISALPANPAVFVCSYCG